MGYKIIKHYLKKNDCYKAGKRRAKTTGIIKHSTGANDPNLGRYIDDPGYLGKNTGGNHWNQTGIAKCVHFMIGLDKAGQIAIYQLLPLDYRCWGCGSGSRGSYNATHVQYEICEDGLRDKKYFAEAFAAAAWLDAYICKMYGLKPDSVVSHKEAHARGYASNHGDCDHWLARQGKTMAWAREQAKKALDALVAGDTGKGDKTTGKENERPKKEAMAPVVKVETARSKDAKLAGTYIVCTKSDALSLRAGAGTDKPKIASLVKNSKVQCYGYYTVAGGAKWLLVSAGGRSGFAHGGYLKRA